MGAHAESSALALLREAADRLEQRWQHAFTMCGSLRRAHVSARFM